MIIADENAKNNPGKQIICNSNAADQPLRSGQCNLQTITRSGDGFAFDFVLDGHRYYIHLPHRALMSFREWQSALLAEGNVLVRHDAEEPGRAGTEGKAAWRREIDAAIERGSCR